MMRNLFNHIAVLTIAAVLCCTAEHARAQFPGGGGGFGGFGNAGGNQQRSSASTARQYPNNGLGPATISIDRDTRSLIVSGDEDTLRYVSQVISNLDRPKPQVLIKVVFLEVTHNDSLDLGIEGSYGKDLGMNSINAGYLTNYAAVPVFSSTGSSNTFVSGFSIFPTNLTPLLRGFNGANNFGLASAGGPAGLYQLFSQDYTATLRAIATSGKAKVLSRPSIVARNNQPAMIAVGQSVPLVNGTRVDNFGNAISSFSYQNVGIILRVTPFIMPDGLVEMILAPETSELVADRSQWIQVQSGPQGSVLAPLINSRSADTVVVTPDAQTVIIGGLMASARAQSETKIPWLGDIPLLGNLFKHRVKNDAQTELMIFLTPYIVQAPTEMVSLSERERAKADALRALNEHELNKFLEDLPHKDKEKIHGQSNSQGHN
jgi:general secretion pathway protein D